MTEEMIGRTTRR